MRSLTNLSYLDLSDNQISDITSLRLLTNLSHLELENNQISDITSLQLLTNLSHLKLENNQISDITSLRSLTNLSHLELDNNQISDITSLRSLTNLSHLELDYNQISDITILQCLANLTFLSLCEIQISDIGLLRSLTNLTELYLSYNKISDITPLQSLTLLTGLYIYANQISDITPLQSLTHLTNLGLGDNQISDITPLQSLTRLTNLNLRNSQISDITPLQYLTKLKCLSLKGNQISNLTPLLSLTRLVHRLKLSFTPEQNALIQASRHKWEILANSTKPIDRAQAASAVKTACSSLNLAAPEIVFCKSIKAELEQLQMSEKSPDDVIGWFRLLNKQLRKALRPLGLRKELQQHLADSLLEWESQLFQHAQENISNSGNYSGLILTRKYLVQNLTVIDFYIGYLGVVFQPDFLKVVETLKQILAECGWILMYENVCYVCDRPIKLSLDTEYRLHAEGESAIEFSDGYKLYSYRGITLPEKYGQIHPDNWQAQWLLEEKNAELRRVLIQGIGYARIARELQATELDCWKEYALLRINADIDGFNPEDFEGDDDAPKKEDIYLLKMTCPSTGHIHALRVPPDVVSAQEAIRWVNWDIDSEDFLVQT